MSGFPKVALGDVAAIDRTVVDPASIEDGTLYVGLENISSGGGFSGVRPVAAGELASSKFAFTQQHLLYGKLRPYLAKIARPDFAGICSTDILPLLPGPDVDRAYLAWLLLTPAMVSVASSRATGANLPRLSPEALKTLRIPLPPLAEQLRIARILDRVETLRRARNATTGNLEELTRSVFLDMFGDPTANPREWPSSRLSEVAEFYAGSTLPPGVDFAGQAEGYFLLKVSDMNTPGNEVYLKTCNMWSDSAGAGACTCPAESVIIPKRGGAIGTNKKRVSVRPCVLDPNLMAIWPKPEHLELPFLYVWFLLLDLKSITSGSSVPQLNKRDLNPLRIITPPVDLQCEFSRVFAGIEEVRVLNDASLAELDTLLHSLQQRAFQGEL